MKSARAVVSLMAAVTLAWSPASSVQAISPDAGPERIVAVRGEVEKVCPSCDTDDAVGGGSVEWDVVSVQITSPPRFAGKTISVSVLLEGSDLAEQRKSYLPTSHIAFAAAESAIRTGRIRLHAADIASAPEGGT